MEKIISKTKKATANHVVKGRTQIKRVPRLVPDRKAPRTQAKSSKQESLFRTITNKITRLFKLVGGEKNANR